MKKIGKYREGNDMRSVCLLGWDCYRRMGSLGGAWHRSSGLFLYKGGALTREIGHFKEGLVRGVLFSLSLKCVISS